LRKVLVMISETMNSFSQDIDESHLYSISTGKASQEETQIHSICQGFWEESKTEIHSRLQRKGRKI